MKRSDSRNETQKALQGDLFAAAQAGVAAPAMPDAAELELIARRKKAPKRLKNTEDDQPVSAASADDAPDAALASAGNADIAESSPFVTASAGEPLRFAQADTGTRTDAGPDTPAAEPKSAGGISTPALIGGVVLLGAAAAGGGGGGGGGGSPAPTSPADTTAPTIASAAVTTTGAQNNILNAGDTITGTVTFSEAVFVTGNPTVTLDIGGTLVQAAYASGSGTNTLTFTYTIQSGQTDTDGIGVPANAIALNGGSIKDAAGNNAVITHEAATSSPAILVDTTAPTVTVTDDVSGTANGPVTFTFTFGEAVTGFTADDISVTNGTKGSFTADSSTVYRLVVTPAAESAGTMTVDVAANAAEDAAGNGSNAASASQAFDTTVPDTTPPTVQSVADNVTGTANLATTSVAYTYTFSESVTGLDASDFTVTHGTISGITGTGATRTVTVTPAAGVASGNISLVLAAGAFTDLAGNANTAGHTENTQAIDTVAPAAPTMTITDSGAADGVTNVNAVTVAGVEAGATWQYSTDSGTTWSAAQAAATTSFVLSDATYATGAIRVRQTDAAGNTTTAPDQNASAITVDTVAPGVGITDNVSATTATGPVTFTFTFNEAVTGFTADDVTVTGGTKGTFTAVSGTEYTLVVNPTPFATGTLTVDVAGAVATDTAGNGNTAAAQATQAFDTTPPATIDLSATSYGGQLILPAYVDGNLYYFWDRDGDSVASSLDYFSHDELDVLFTQNFAGATNPGTGTDDTYRYATLNGVKLALPTLGIGSPEDGFYPGTAVNDTPAGQANPTYDDLAAIWDAFNGSGTVAGGNEPANLAGQPAGWPSDGYWSATPIGASENHWGFNMFYGFANQGYPETNGYYVALQVVV